MAGGSVEEGGVIFVCLFPVFLRSPAGGELYLGRYRFPGRWLLRFGRLGRWLPHAKDERPDLITPASFKDEAEAVEYNVTPFMSSSNIIQEAIEHMTGSLQILGNHPGLGKASLFIFYHDFKENGPHICDTLDHITFHSIPS